MFIIIFLVCSIVNRLLVEPELNKDYFGYYDLHNFNDPDDIYLFLISEPYLYLVYKFFGLFNSDKAIILSLIYWLNFFITNAFFVWLLRRGDVSVWKKVTLFSFYYFLFGYVLLRNAPVYILFACFIYYSYRNKKYYKVLFTPLMHLSALALIVLIFNKQKSYFKALTVGLAILVPLMVFYFLPLLNGLILFEYSVNKIETYSDGMLTVSIFHKIYFAFICLTLVMTIFMYKRRAINPIIVTTALLYFVSYFINPVLGFRLSPYVFMSIFLYNNMDYFSPKWTKVFDYVSLLLLPYFISTLFSTHHL